MDVEAGRPTAKVYERIDISITGRGFISRWIHITENRMTNCWEGVRTGLIEWRVLLLWREINIIKLIYQIYII